jgi:acetoacetyl-CoA synthetase
MLDSMDRDASDGRHHSAANAADQPIFTPSPERVAASRLTAFTRFLEGREGRRFEDQRALHRFSVQHDRAFWGAFLDWSALPVSGDPEPVRTTGLCETATFWPNLRLNYAEALLAGNDDDLAVVSINGDGGAIELSRGVLRERVLRMAGGLRGLGLRAGDPVLAILRNDAEAVVAALAVATLGGVLSTASADSGVELLAGRMADFAPRLLIAALEPLPHDAGAPLAERVAALAGRLPSLEAVIALDGGAVDSLAIPLHRASDLRGRAAAFEHHPFNQPLFVLFSSGTTGTPKGFVHGAGGTLVEHVKEHRLHGDLGQGDRLFFQTSPAWMMWHWQLSALATGAAIVLREAPVDGPETLWRVAAEQGVTVFGTSPPYLRLCETLGFRPADTLDLSRLRAVLSTGSILQPGQARWVQSAVGPMPVQSVSGGSDIIGCFVLGSPNLPTFAGEAQCLGLGLDVRAAGDGELICAAPFPSRPLCLLGDADGSRFHDTYFARHGAAWSHGDLIEITPRGGAIMRGRMDGVLNVRGIRVGPAEIYAVLADLPQIAQALAVEQDLGDGDARMVLLVVMAPGAGLDAALSGRIRRLLTERASAAHAPETILAVDALPTTHSGKLSEAAATAAVNGRDPGNLAALRNPETLTAIRQAVAAHVTAAAGELAGTEGWLASVWAEILRRDAMGPDDDFFDLGGHSLAAARVLAEVRERTGRTLPMATLLQAPTVRRMAALIDDPHWSGSRRLVPLREGEGEPFFMVHSMTGNVLQLHGLIRSFRTARPVYGLQAVGLEHGETPLDSVEAMAAVYVEAIRALQPRGPYRLGGFSFGGLVAFEMARLLEAEGEAVARLILLDSQMDKRFLPLGERSRLMGARLAHHARRIVGRPGEAIGYLRDRLRALAGHRVPPPPAQGIPPHIEAVRAGILAATERYAPGRYGGALIFVKPLAPPPLGYHPEALWKRVARGGAEVVRTAGDHDSMIEPPHVAALAMLIDARLG